MNKIKQLFSGIYRYFYPIDLVTMYKRMGVEIGENCKFQFGVTIDHSHYWHINIGNNVTLAPKVHILAHDASTKLHLGYTRIGRVKIEDGVFIGASSIVLPGVSIGSNSIIGAGSVVTKSVPKDMVAAGNPAKIICSLDDYLSRKRLEFEQVPKFGEEYTLRAAITQNKKKYMNDILEDGFVYVE